MMRPSPAASHDRSIVGIRYSSVPALCDWNNLFQFFLQELRLFSREGQIKDFLGLEMGGQRHTVAPSVSGPESQDGNLSTALDQIRLRTSDSTR